MITILILLKPILPSLLIPQYLVHLNNSTSSTFNEITSAWHNQHYKCWLHYITFQPYLQVTFLAFFLAVIRLLEILHPSYIIHTEYISIYAYWSQWIHTHNIHSCLEIGKKNWHLRFRSWGFTRICPATLEKAHIYIFFCFFVFLLFVVLFSNLFIYLRWIKPLFCVWRLSFDRQIQNLMFTQVDFKSEMGGFTHHS